MEMRENSLLGSAPGVGFPNVPSAAPAPSEPELSVSSRPFDADALTRALRIAGAALVVASASTFMLQHWQGGNDLIRYGMLVGQSLLLAIAAYFVGLTLREGRSARTFLALVLAIMPVSFAVLGGLVYSQFHLEAVAVLPSYATWVAPSKLWALLAVGGTLVVLVPLAVVSFMALARKEAKALTIAFALSNLLVLLPVRAPSVVVAIAGAALLTLLRLELTRFATSAQLDTLEGKLARVMPFVPPLLMLGRVFHLYQVSLGFVGGVCIIAAALLWLRLSRTTTPARKDAGAWAAAIAGTLGWLMCAWDLTAFVSSTALEVVMWGVPASALFFMASLRAAQTRGTLLGVATIGGLGSVLLATVVDGGSVSALGCIVVGVTVAVWGAAVQARVRTVAGALVALWGLGLQVWLATHADSVLRWLVLSVVGVLLIVGSAYVEKHRVRIIRLWEAAAARRLRQEDVSA
jgi:hypothetical protein